MPTPGDSHRHSLLPYVSYCLKKVSGPLKRKLGVKGQCYGIHPLWFQDCFLLLSDKKWRNKSLLQTMRGNNQSVQEDTGPATQVRCPVLGHVCRKRSTARKSCTWNKMRLLIHVQSKLLHFALCLLFPLNLKCLCFPEHISSSGCGPPGQGSRSSKGSS